MAAAEYYNATAAAQAAPQYSPHYQPPRPPYHELHGSIPQYSLPPSAHQQRPPPPPYQPIQQDHKPAIHFTPTSAPHSGPPSRPHSSRPSFSSQHRPSQGQHLVPPPHNTPYAQHGSPNLTPQMLAQPPHMRHYMTANQSAYSLNNGYSSDPEEKRRRRHKHHHHHRDDEDRSRDSRPKSSRSRSSNKDSFLGAAGGGLIGDLICPGLGTVGGAVAGWIGGRDYGKHRKYREDKLQKDQKDWEDRFRDRSHSRERRHSDDRYPDHKRHNSAY